MGIFNQMVPKSVTLWTKLFIFVPFRIHAPDWRDIAYNGPSSHRATKGVSLRWQPLPLVVPLTVSVGLLVTLSHWAALVHLKTHIWMTMTKCTYAARYLWMNTLQLCPSTSQGTLILMHLTDLLWSYMQISSATSSLYSLQVAYPELDNAWFPCI